MPTLHPFHRAAVLVSLLVLAVSARSAEQPVRINQIQVIGTHNSYHVGFAPAAAGLMKQFAPKVFAGLDYSHPPLTQQLDDGVRQFELDVYADSKGGLYAHPAITGLIAGAGLPSDPPIAAPGVMDKPGFKVMHVQDIDQRSRCQPFAACLTEIRQWSKAHPDHVPVFVLIETKQSPLELPTDLPVQFKSVTPESFTPAVFDALDAEITSVFPRNEIITPDDVRGSHATLDAAVRHGSWPTLADARGKVMFLMDQKSVGQIYLKGHPSLSGRILFTNATPGQSDAAFVECNGCSAEKNASLVKQGYLVRTRTDEPGNSKDRSRPNAMLASGAQILSTDYPAGEPDADGYEVGLPNAAAVRCNPVNKPMECDIQPAR